MATLHYLAQKEEIPPGGRKIFQIGKKSVGVFNISGEFHALLNVCPHQFAPLCTGKVCGFSPPSEVGQFVYERQGEIIRCPWHGWEFDIKTGKSIFDPQRVKTASFAVHQGPPDESRPHSAPSVETFPVVLEHNALFIELP